MTPASFPVITHARLLAVARRGELALAGSAELAQAVRFLHQTGVLVHHDDPSLGLDSLYFLNPAWLCHVMAQVVTVREINPFVSPTGVRIR